MLKYSSTHAASVSISL
ncbi:unnamed protein product [Gulo gulo]|uniref:Uncharacterized protein n=1 Tax=Gulo gulo TaxID=48420 RepID=A0A9X9QA22_GULGU|nr:unnamed protein product [Gulo gulo]